MSSILERLRSALAPSYEVERELASGGMGSVFLARDVSLDRTVAVKILRPELATALAAERFIREARILASLSHPNIVPVHHAGEAGGFFYYVMNYVDGETLQHRLKRGPVTVDEIAGLGGDLLSALEAAHKLGIIHRDIKPSNVFLVGDRALLGDFGIAKRVEESSSQLTRPGHRIGTPDYMPPEQVAGRVTLQTDIYAVGMVLYEAITGRKWSILTPTDDADWWGVPRGVAHVLRRALAWSPDDRWPDARSFRAALHRALRGVRLPGLAIGLAALVVAGVAAALVFALRAPPSPPALSGARLPFGIEPCPCFVQSFQPRDDADDELARAVTEEMVQALSGGGFQGASEDISVAGGLVRTVIGGEVAVSGGTIWIEARAEPAESQPLIAQAEGPRENWRSLIDGLADQLLRGIWNSNPEARWLPPRTLPQTTRGLVAWLRGESLYWDAQWGSAYEAYRSAELVDTTCWLCSFRSSNVEHWVGIRADDRSEEHFRAHIESFPPEYRSVIQALDLPLSERLAALTEVTARHPVFYYGWFARGDEVLHRGALIGDRRSEAADLLGRAILLRGDFAPAWEHRAWVQIAEGNQTAAAEALATLEAMAPVADMSDVATLGLRGLLQLGFAWRFLPQDQAIAITDTILANPIISALPELAAGPRMLVYFDAPLGAVWVWDRLAELPVASRLDPSGLLAQIFGYVALGRIEAAAAVAEKLQLSEPNMGLFVAELDAALTLLDSDSAEFSLRWPAAKAKLTRYARPGPPLPIRRRAAWMLMLLAQRAGAEVEVAEYRGLFEDEPDGKLRTLLQANRAASAGRWRQALEISEGLQAYKRAWEAPDPFFRTVLHLLRGEWHQSQDLVQGALRELRWHENDDLKGNPAAEPQPAEVDWAFGTLARWRRAELLYGINERGAEVCSAYLAVARLWEDGDSRYAMKAESARHRAELLGCTDEMQPVAVR